VIGHPGAVTNRDVPVIEGQRRPGDCTKLVSGSSRAETELGWTPTHSTMGRMIEDAWHWHRTGHYEK
jgi:UDP-glucose 4-epimerase